MLYNSTKTSAGAVMPLLMGCTMQSGIQECQDDRPSYYDPFTQRTYDARVVGTYSLKTTATRLPSKATISDKKNAIDDQKSVR